MTTPGFLDDDARRRVSEIFHQALELAPAERPTFVRKAADSVRIADEVLSLLDAYDGGGHQLTAPLPDAAHLRALAADAALKRVGQTIGQYRIDGILGQGGMGVVYLAFDQRLNIPVALKAISPAVTGDPVRRERLRREAQIVAKLKHPGIAWVYALEEFDGDLFIAGEFIAGETLREEIGQGPVDAATVLSTAIDLASALAAAHDQGIIHRDLKPENVMREAQGRVRILDFGLARMRDLPDGEANLTGERILFGTPGYMSPEQIRFEPMDGRSDLFSLGILLYELLTGVHPFGGEDSHATMKAIVEKNSRPFRDSSDAPPAGSALMLGLEGIIRTLLRKTPAARFASAHQLHAALERLRDGDRSAAAFGGVQTDALWWWKFHQAATCTFYALLLIPTWFARRSMAAAGYDFTGRLLLLTAIVAVVAAIMLRTHLWFAASSMPGEFAHQHKSNWKWVRGADLLLVAAVEASGFAILGGHDAPVAVLLVTCGVLALLSSAVIEPATTRAAFGRE